MPACNFPARGLPPSSCSPMAGLSVPRFAASASVPSTDTLGASLLLSSVKASSSLVLLPPVARESRRLLATSINPLRGPFGPSLLPAFASDLRCRGKLDRLPHATAGFTTSAPDAYGLRCRSPTRPAPYASDPVFVHRLVRLLHASFRPHLTMTPLRFARPQAVEHARHTIKKGSVTGALG
jgi:hypothetical protein